MNSGEAAFGVREAVHRGYNMLIATVLGLTALTFGTELFVEADAVDKIDNTLLAAIGVVAVVWYFLGKNWTRRSAIPLGLVAAALLVQIFGVLVELDDPTALGDDIPGMILFTPLLILAAVLYSMNAKLLASAGASPA